ncbi:MAG: threonine--tRNA ligase [Verrucomicrobiota bacterium]
MNDNRQMSPIDTLRHSTAHVMATAILKLWPNAQFAYGPPIENGFYYDVELDHRLSPEDFASIESEMKKIVKENQTFERVELPREEALELARAGRLGALFERDTESTFKIDLINEIPEGETISIYKNGDFWDLCAGPHVPRTGNCKAYKLLSVASAYYKGDADNAQLQRVYGTAFKNKTELNEHLERLEQAKERDHRKLGRELDLFHIDEEAGQGLILWMPNGAIVRQELQTFITEELTKQGYSQVFTPHIGKLDLYRTSGHFPYYQDSQYPPVIERDQLQNLADEGCTCAQLSNKVSEGEIDGYLLKPMNCPHHIKLFAARPHSYRDLPVRLAEFGTVYRWEQSGELGGMTRVRGFTQDDAHLFCTEDQVAAEIAGCLDLVKLVFKTIGMHDSRVRIGLRDPDSSKYTGDPANWDKAEAALRDAAQNLGVPFTEEAGEAAFYGPKIDFVVKDVIGREWQLGTVQVDYNLPERFDLSYIGADNEKHRPVMIHRAPFGSMERFVGVLIEHFNGAFPVWLAPEQARFIPITDDQIPRARELEAEYKAAGIRCSVDDVSDKMGAKIRRGQLDKIPYLLVLGKNEIAEDTLAVRSRQHGDEGPIPTQEFFTRLKSEIANRTLTTKSDD